jgi:ribosomal protein S11
MLSTLINYVVAPIAGNSWHIHLSHNNTILTPCEPNSDIQDIESDTPHI